MVEETKEIPKEIFPEISIEAELKKSYMDYAMSVIVGRALPDVRDGLKPVHRRALFAMRELNNYHNRPYLKSARIVGDVIGKYHPHGDTAAYDTIVRMAQDFSMRYLLVDGQGNFGSVDGDSPAAMRYTEARMTKLVQEIIADLDKETVEFTPTYDNSLMEPVVFPAKVPTLLINGSSGIAVGMATNIPPHNLTEVMDGLIALIDNPSISIHQLMDIITGPDFPTAAYICGRAGIREAYETGRGSILMRSKTEVEKSKKANRESIIITEIPYQQNKASLIEKIAMLIKDKKIDSISEVRDESDRRGMRIVLELKKDEIADVVLNQLYKMTPLQRSFGVILLSIVNGRPEILNLKQILQHFLLHRKTIVYRRTAYDLRKTEEKAHILEGLKIAISNLDEVVELIKASPGPKEARQGLMDRYELSEIQAQAILDMRLQRLTGLERDKIVEEYEELMHQIARFKEILADEKQVLKIIHDEFEEIKEKYGDERRTEITEAPDEILPEDMIAQEEMVVTVSHEGHIKRNQADLYRSQRRGGKGVKGMQTHEEDFVNSLYLANTHDTFLFLTNYGKVFHRRVFEIPPASRIARGKALVNLLDLTPGEKVAAIMPVKSFELQEGEECYVMMVTKKGIVKKTDLREYARSMRRGKIALKIREGDEIISAVMTRGNNDIMLFSSNGMSVRFNEQRVRPMGRTASGVKGMTLNPGDTVVGVVVVDYSTESILSVTENGFGKRTAVADYPVRNRGGKGVFTIKTSKRNGKAIGALQVVDDDEIMMITNGGKIIRTNMKNVRVIGRNTQGVNLFRLGAGEKVVGMDRMAEPSGDDDEESNETEISPED
ncbi:MAG: DNA gyrase subunit A [Desulfobulbaceae bacterium]|jgi:DNA gyrase subunit A|nr:DNA gyrase subunit A [Desulfobulbaceae bacterium]MDH3995861.1 DNA gyrase subunit A [Desulfobulbaceae bacterium]